MTTSTCGRISLNATFKMYSLDEKLDAYLAHCDIKWGVFIMSMKSCIGTGRGQTYPNGVYIEFDE